MNRGRNDSRPAGVVRIIGGRWRGTKLPVPDVPGLRPSSDRVRETLFNWLQPALPGARVLDLFAGTGALGLEALSRGAAAVTLVERDRAACAGLRASIDRLGAGAAAKVVTADALAWLAGATGDPFDIVFVDPPFADDLWVQVMAGLAAHVAPEAWLYVESAPRALADPGPGWTLHREGATREVAYRLYRRDPG
ncbi:16S rRNA (guanine(966)-N(2))-methyltransferase RsmD [Solilutibacter silvestris]|uniref:Ribosomal RNA small subunit methyltransferase D n=1 Tax=Solilutibacter silvestris TaxID=1645665 RepID=A0A2K1PXZ1_9GAMM|nr:16S rRNA (guanine(966)-N(2))-methyltransferase RsmD [Lysobacter silvestris]PNS07656.1 RNA methyltransferase, RsmD family [Lysobacter silvestris]